MTRSASTGILQARNNSMAILFVHAIKQGNALSQNDLARTASVVSRHSKSSVQCAHIHMCTVHARLQSGRGSQGDHSSAQLRAARKKRGDEKRLWCAE